MGQCLADFGGDKRRFPVGGKIRERFCDQFGVVVEDRDAGAGIERIGRRPAPGLRGENRIEKIAQILRIHLRAEHQVAVPVGPHPEQDLQFILHEPRQHPLVSVRNELAETRGFHRQLRHRLIRGVLLDILRRHLAVKPILLRLGGCLGEPGV